MKIYELLSPARRKKNFILITLLASFILLLIFRCSIRELNYKRNLRLSVYIEAISEINILAPSPLEKNFSHFTSGIVFWRTGYILTAAHLLDKIPASNKIYVSSVNGSKLEAKILARDKNLDVMAIRIQHDFGSEIPIGRDEDIISSENIYAIGCPLGACRTKVIGNFMMHGEQTAFHEFNNYLLFDMTAMPGSSGEGIFDKTGNLFGICVSYHSEQNGLAAGSRPNLIREFLEKNRLPYRKAALFW